jgi:hypothetical protein
MGEWLMGDGGICVMGERYDCTMIFSLVWMNHSTPRQTDPKSRANIFAIETQAESLFGMLLAIVFINNPTTPQPITKQKQQQ